jgi:hypothetical protein
METAKEQPGDKYPCPLISLETPGGIIFTPRMKRDGEGGWTWENPDYVNRMMGLTKNGAGGGSSQ